MDNVEQIQIPMGASLDLQSRTVTANGRVYRFKSAEYSPATNTIVLFGAYIFNNSFEE